MPFDVPPVAAVYVNVIVRPVCDALTVEIDAAIEPDPSAAYTVMEGDEMLVKVPLLRDSSCPCHVCAPVVDVAVAPEPPPDLSPYVIVIVAPPASVTPDTVITCAATATVPVLAVVYPPLLAVVDGAVQPLGTVSLIPPFCIPPDAAVYVNVIVLPV